VAPDDLAHRRVRPAGGTVLKRSQIAELVDGLADVTVNYDEADAPDGPADPRWHVDSGYAVLGVEPPGDPVPDGPWERACALVRAYEFTDHRLLRGAYRPADPLLGRDMILEGRVFALRFYMGVRVTATKDETVDGLRVWGWTYETLHGHLEQGKLTYEVTKDLDTGQVVFWIHAYSRRSGIPNPVYRFGFHLFGRATQLDFYRRVGRKMRELVDAGAVKDPEPRDGLVIAPVDRDERWWDALALEVPHPGV
jgi:hypothetical protein